MSNSSNSVPVMIADDEMVDHYLRRRGHFSGKFVAVRDLTNGAHNIRCYVSASGGIAHSMLVRLELLEIYGATAVPSPNNCTVPLSVDMAEHVLGGGKMSYVSGNPGVEWGSITLQLEFKRDGPENAEEANMIINALRQWILDKVAAVTI